MCSTNVNYVRIPSILNTFKNIFFKLLKSKLYHLQNKSNDFPYLMAILVRHRLCEREPIKICPVFETAPSIHKGNTSLESSCGSGSSRIPALGTHLTTSERGETGKLVSISFALESFSGVANSPTQRNTTARIDWIHSPLDWILNRD